MQNLNERGTKVVARVRLEEEEEVDFRSTPYLKTLKKRGLLSTFVNFTLQNCLINAQAYILKYRNHCTLTY